MGREMILLERVTDGENCGRDCQNLMCRGGSHDGGLCALFARRLILSDGRVFRCYECLDTPAAVALTEAQAKVLRVVKINADLRGDTDEAEALVEAFPALFPKGGV